AKISSRTQTAPGQSSKRLLPTRLLLVDGATVVGKQRIRKAADFHFGDTIVHGSVDYGGSTFEPLVIGYTRSPLQLVQQGLFFGIHRRLLAHLLGGLFGFNQGHFLIAVSCTWQKFIDIRHDGISNNACDSSNTATSLY